MFKPLINDPKHPVWVAWVKHVAYVKLMVQHSFTTTQILQLDKAVYDANVAFNKVPQYKGFFKPKQHFGAHASVNILRMGPLRGYALRASKHALHPTLSNIPLLCYRYWCYSFEGFHQRVKRIARNSNYRNVSKRILVYWAIQFGLTMSQTTAKERRALSNLC